MKPHICTLLLVCALALPCFANPSRNSPPAQWVQQGDLHDLRFEPDEALKYYLEAEKLSPMDSALLVKIARQYVYRMDDLSGTAAKLASAQTALFYAQRAVASSPSSGEPYLALAIVWGKMTPLLSTKEKLQASRKIKEAAEKSIQLDPGNDYAWHMLGRWHQAMAGMSSLTRGIAQVVYGAMPAASNEESVRCFQKALSLNPNRLIHSVELGRTLAQMGNRDEALKYLRRGLAMPNRERDDAATKERGKAVLKQLE